MALNREELVRRGMNAEQAKALVTEFGGTVVADNLLRMGFSVPLANELTAQKNGSALVESKLMALGMPGALAAYVVANG